jgi:antitoxin component of MazEF toxin-antitoxin module
MSEVITCYNNSMKVTVRRVGNSLGILLPKSTLAAWGVGEGGHLELTELGIHPIARTGLSHDVLDEHKRKLAAAVAAGFTAHHIRAQSLANLHRWKKSGAWVSAYSEWEKILKNADDGELFAVLLGRDERANRLRQSPPYIGLLPREEVRKLNEEATP